MRDRKASGLRRHQNAGENTSGAHRNVARDVYRPPETLSGLRTTVENPWRFVLACLVSSSKSDNTDSPPRVKVLDIILMESTGGGHPEDFFLTASDGSVQRKSERFLSLKSHAILSRAHERFTRGVRSRDVQDPAHDVIAMARTRNEEYISVTSDALRTAVKAGAMPAEFDCLYPNVCAKGFATTFEFANYLHEYVLNDASGGVSNGTAYRRVAASGPSEKQANYNVRNDHRQRRSDFVLSRNAGLNTEINAAARAVALAIERVKHCRVLNLATEFALDDRKNLWLVGATYCRIASRPPGGLLTRSTSPPGNDGISGIRIVEATARTRKDVSPNVGNTHILATAERSQNRREEEAASVLSDNEFSLLLQRIGYRSPIRRRCGRRGGLTRNNQSRSGEPPCPESALLPDDIRIGAPGSWSSQPFEIIDTEARESERNRNVTAAEPQSFSWTTPEDQNSCGEASDDRSDCYANELRSLPSQGSTSIVHFKSYVNDLDQEATNKIYGSSQLEGCRGDFCDFDVGKKVRDEEDRKRFIHKAARAAGAASGLAENLTPLRLKIMSLDDDLIGGDLGSGVPTAVGVRPGGRGPKVTRHTDTASEQYAIPYKAVVQARQERTLVEAFLRRYSRGEKGNYCRFGEDGMEGRYLIGGRFPGVYYRPVKVCSTCHMVYTLVDQARARALLRMRGDGGRGGGKHRRLDRKFASSAPEVASFGSGDQSSSTAVLAAARPEADDGFEHSPQALSLAEARKAIDAVSQGDVSELRSFCRPPAAVVHVASAAVALLDGIKSSDNAGLASWTHARAALGSSDFFSRLQTLDPRTLTRCQLRALEPVLESPGFRPEAVRAFSNAAANMSLWVLGVVQANQWMMGRGHPRRNIVPAADDIIGWGKRTGAGRGRGGGCASVASFQEPALPAPVRRVEQEQPRRRRQGSPSPWRTAGRKRRRFEIYAMKARIENNGLATSPMLDRGTIGLDCSQDESTVHATPTSQAERNCQDFRGAGQIRKDRAVAKAFASSRPMNPYAQSSTRGDDASRENEFVCSDRTTRLPYRVCGEAAASGSDVSACNFVVVHDFFDNVDKTEVFFRPITRQHLGCRVLAFSYPGQAGTVFEVPASMATSSVADSGAGNGSRASTPAVRAGGDREIGAERREAVPNNAFMAPRLHELLQHVHCIGDMRLTSPFHLVGIGNGTAIAIAFALRYGDHPLYRSSLRSVVSINGFSSVDAQLAAVLHSSVKVFAALPPTRPDLPVSFMSRYVFSEDYLSRVGRNLALGIYTAVSNPVTLEGRHLVCNSALLHEDLSREVGTLGVPLVLLQSTENVLVNPANVDPFLRGRSSIHHFWSHEFRGPPPVTATGGKSTGSDSRGGGCDDVGEGEGYSVYGRKGLTDLLRALSKPRGTFMAWVWAGHEVRQECKRAVMDLFDALAKPTPEYTGVDAAEVVRRGAAEGVRSTVLGLYPSTDFVARVNHRNQVEDAGVSATHQTVKDRTGRSARGGKSAEMNEAEEDPPIRTEPSLQRPEMTVDYRPDKREPLPTATSRMKNSPFSRDINIPSLPAPARRPNAKLRNVSNAPQTSPIKRSRAVAPAPSSRNHGTRSPTTGDAAMEAFPVEEDGRGEELELSVCINRNATRRWRPHALAGGGRSGSSRVLLDSATKCLRVAHADRHRGAENGTTMVWEEDAVAEVGRQKAAPEGTVQDSANPGRSNYSTSFFPAAALVYDAPVADRRGDSLGDTRSDESTSLQPADPSLSRDPWDVMGSAPSIDLVSSDSRQRAKRRWISYDEALGKGHEDGHRSTDGNEKEENCSSKESCNSTTCGTGVPSNGTPDPGAVAPVHLLNDLLVAEACLEGRLCEVRHRAADRRQAEEAAAERRIAGIQGAQEARSRAYAEADEKLIAELEKELATARLARASVDLQRAVNGADLDDEIARAGIMSPASSAVTISAVTRTRGEKVPGGGHHEKGTGGDYLMTGPSRAMPPLDYSLMEELPEQLRRTGDAYSLMADAARDQIEMARSKKEAGGSGVVGGLAQFQMDQAAAASETAAKRLAARTTYKSRDHSELERAKFQAAVRVQPFVRGVLARRRVALLRCARNEYNRRVAAALKIQAMARGRLGKQRARDLLEAAMAEIVLGGSVLRLQRVGRGMLGRRRAAARRRGLTALTVQRCFRGYIGRRYAAKQRALLEMLRARHMAAVRIQACWRGKRACDAYASRRAFALSAVEIQRVYRGVIGRRKANRRLEWAKTEHGPARLKLGMRLIEDTKVAFERQRMEIANLHVAEEKAELRTDRIRKELGSSEKELSALEREMNEIDHIEDQLRQLTHERSLVQKGLLRRGQGLQRTDVPSPALSEGTGEGGGREEIEQMLSMADKEAGFALEMQIQIKRAEREKKRQELEADFKSVCGAVDRKRRELARVGEAIQEIEATRERKMSEFRRMQANLMELLHEQKTELDAVREKGVQLEVASATSAAAATATAQRAKDHEEKSSAMFSQTEELMKFQFMSMSLSYFSSLNMLKTMRDINADTTTAAVTSSADAAAAAAASAAAASLPAIKAGKVIDSISDVLCTQINVKSRQTEQKIAAEEELEVARAHPFPRDVRFWTTADVGLFLESLGLQQYRRAFQEAAVDGDFLLALDAKDCADVLGVEHTLHSKKLFLAIDKLRPLNKDEQKKKELVEREEHAENLRGESGPPDVETVFSQVRNGRMKRLEESLERGFPVDTEDEHGNSLLLVACQNVSVPMCEMLLRRGANINHQNVRGNTALHFAMAYDSEGVLGEMLISSGADDSIENQEHLSCYDGLGLS